MSVMLLVHRRCKWEGTLNNMRRNAGARDDLEASTVRRKHTGHVT